MHYIILSSLNIKKYIKLILTDTLHRHKTIRTCLYEVIATNLFCTIRANFSYFPIFRP